MSTRTTIVQKSHVRICTYIGRVGALNGRTRTHPICSPAKLKVKELGNIVEMTTPFLDRHNDRLQIFVKRLDNDLLLTDDGYILSDLSLSGMDIHSEKRQRLLTTIRNGFGVRLDGECLTAKATMHSFPQQKHALLQAMLTVNVRPRPKSH